MTSPALLVLLLAHVCTIFGKASDFRADHQHTDKMALSNLWTNSYKNLDESNGEVHKIIHDEIYTENENIRPDANFNVKIKNSDNFRTFDSKIIDINSNLENKYLKKYKQRDIVENIDELIDLSEKINTEDIKTTKVKEPFVERVKRDNSQTKDAEKKTDSIVKRVKRDEYDQCQYFLYNEGNKHISHPHLEGSTMYSNNTDCVTVITAPEGHTIELTFVDHFHIEYHPDCAYDYLEVRDGSQGYSKLLGRVCGQAYPRVMTTSGPYAWLKFHSDDTIEYEGFNIKVEKRPDPASYSIPAECNITQDIKEATHGYIKSEAIPQKCRDGSAGKGLDVIWTIKTKANHKIFLNFTHYELKSPNKCDQNGIQIFGSVLELSSKLEHFCGSVANPVSTAKDDNKGDPGNIMFIRLYTSKDAMSAEQTKFQATYTAFRNINPSNDEECLAEEFDCADNTCIDASLKCNGEANCRLKTDEDEEACPNSAKSPLEEDHITVILVIFSLILSAMMVVFLFKCIKKLYQDHKIIKEHIRQSCEDRLDRLDSLVGSRLTLDAKRLQRDSEPRASLERENQANEMFKRKRDSFSKRQPTSIDSDFQETQIDIDEEIWRREAETQIEPEDVRIERNGRTRHARKESVRSKRESGEREIRDVSVGAPDTKESGCQTRESLFATDPPVSSDGSGSNSRGFSTFGYSGATLVRPSPPTNTSEITIELLKHAPRQDSVKPQKKIDRRPMSTETTRSAPDVIIVSKPIR